MSKVSIITAAIVLLLSSSCTTLYKPNAVHSPLLKKKGEAHVAGALSLVGSANANAQGAFAFSDHGGLMVNMMQHSRNRSYGLSGDEKLRMRALEAGFGYFTKLDNQEEFLIQVYGGMGAGRSRAVIEDGMQTDIPETSGKYYYIFIQPGIAYVSKIIDVALDTRINRVQMYDVKAYLYEKFEWWNTDYRLYDDAALSFAILEPTLTIKAGSPAVRGVFQFGATVPVFHPEAYYSVSFSPLMKMSVGIQYRFGAKE